MTSLPLLLGSLCDDIITIIISERWLSSQHPSLRLLSALSPSSPEPLARHRSREGVGFPSLPPPSFPDHNNAATISLCSPVSARRCGEKAPWRVPVSQPLFSSPSDAMWNAPSCHQTQYPTYKRHGGIINPTRPSPVNAPPSGSRPMLTYRGYMEST